MTQESQESSLPAYELLHLQGADAQAQGDFALAEDCYARALALKQDYAFSRLALAQMRMLRSHFHEGREQYEARFDAVTEGSGPDWRGLPLARWRGESITDKKIYIWAEQGLGDMVMFAGFLPWLLAQRPRYLALGMFAKLIPLLARSFPDIAVESLDDAMYLALAPAALEAYPKLEQMAGATALPFPLGPLKAAHEHAQRHGLFELAAPMGDLLVYGLPNYIPARHASSYLRADPVRVAATRTRLSRIMPGRRIGISWATTNRREPMRNVPLEAWAALLQIQGCHFISLQHHVKGNEIQAFCQRSGCHLTVDHEVDLGADAEGLAALIASMDEVITIDNSNVHLAGALGVPTTLLLPKGHNFRWPEQKDAGLLWYKNVHALRQLHAGDWTQVMSQACAELQQRLRKNDLA